MKNEITEFILEKIRNKGAYTDPDSSILSKELFDSFDYLELIMAVEQKYNIAFDLSVPQNVATANGLIAEVCKRLNI